MCFYLISRVFCSICSILAIILEGNSEVLLLFSARLWCNSTDQPAGAPTTHQSNLRSHPAAFFGLQRVFSIRISIFTVKRMFLFLP